MPDSGLTLTPDCSNCAALCCIMLPFDAGSTFGFDKAGGEACRHLSGHQCRIHAELESHGFSGCRRYDCMGAGQRVVQQVFGGQSWRDDAALTAPMEAAFRAMRRLHEDYALLDAASRLTLTEAENARRQALLQTQNAGAPQTRQSLLAYETGPLPRAVAGFVADLKARMRPHR